MSQKNSHLFKKALVGLLISVGLFSCSQESQETLKAQVEYITIDWVNLIPKDDLDALMNPPDYLDQVIDGSEADLLESNVQTQLDQAPKTDYERALVSANVVPEYNETHVRLPGFVVPLEFDEDFVVSEFFLVPYFGACLHSPPPPPNQIIFVKSDKGFELQSLQQPFWVSGFLTTEDEVNDTAHAAYSISASEVTPYYE